MRFPHDQLVDLMLSCLLQMLRAKQAEDRALIDLKFHFMHSTLDEVVRTACCHAQITT